MQLMFDWRAQYDSERDAVERALTDIDTGTESLVQQAPAIDADINTIVRRFGIGDSLPPQAVDPRYFGDLGEIPDLGTALRLVKDAQDKFAALPVDLRNRFNNSPAALWDFVNNPNNGPEAVKLGLLKVREPAPSETPVPPASSTSSSEVP